METFENSTNQNTIYWHDYETFGANPQKDRPSQFAGIRTDFDLNIIGEPLIIYCKPAPDFLPHPEACLITGITPQHAQKHGLIEAEVSNQRLDSMACVSLPTCPLAMAEAERYLPDAVTELEGLLAKHGLADDSIIFRVTGCPNGCGRAMLAEVGLVGKGPGKYNFHLGGDREGTRIPKMYRENISEEEIMSELDSLIGKWAKERNGNESFGDYVIRAEIVAPVVDSARDFYE